MTADTGAAQVPDVAVVDADRARGGCPASGTAVILTPTARWAEARARLGA
jgi:hypothetical protein